MMEVYKTNVVGPFLCTRTFLPQLLKKQRRVVVNISSRLGSIAEKIDVLHGGGRDKEPSVAAVAYNCSKAALNMRKLPTLPGSVLSSATTRSQFPPCPPLACTAHVHIHQ